MRGDGLDRSTRGRYERSKAETQRSGMGKLLDEDPSNFKGQAPRVSKALPGPTARVRISKASILSFVSFERRLSLASSTFALDREKHKGRRGLELERKKGKKGNFRYQEHYLASSLNELRSSFSGGKGRKRVGREDCSNRRTS